MNAPHQPRVHFGGPCDPPRRLRDVLEERVDAVPRGGEIAWVTYYFRDLALAEALVRAHRRGVAVRVALEAHPRLEGANEAVRCRLADALGSGLRAVSHARWRRAGRARALAHLHTKIYSFSHPSPAALVGSFNPSGNLPQQPEVIREIGDQDRGHNLLLEIGDPDLVRALGEHARWLHGSRHGLFERFTPTANRVVRAEGMEVFFQPRLASGRWLRALEPQRAVERVRVAASHLNERRTLRLLARLARRGATVEVIAHDTLRRVPQRSAEALRAAGVSFRRYEHPEGLPMHHKFLLVETARVRRTLLGSLNLTDRSRWLNHEIAIVSEDRELFRVLAARWDRMAAEPAVRGGAG